MVSLTMDPLKSPWSAHLFDRVWFHKSIFTKIELVVYKLINGVPPIIDDFRIEYFSWSDWNYKMCMIRISFINGGDFIDKHIIPPTVQMLWSATSFFSPRDKLLSHVLLIRRFRESEVLPSQDEQEEVLGGWSLVRETSGWSPRVIPNLSRLQLPLLTHRVSAD